MDGWGRWMNNRFIERLWRSVEYEDIYLQDYLDGGQAGQVDRPGIQYRQRCERISLSALPALRGWLRGGEGRGEVGPPT